MTEPIVNPESDQGPPVQAPQVQPPQQAASGKLTSSQFAAAVRKKHPEYGDVGDDDLTSAVLKKYPEYSSTVDMPGQQSSSMVQAPGSTEPKVEAPKGAFSQAKDWATKPLISGKSLLNSVGNTSRMLSPGTPMAERDVSLPDEDYYQHLRDYSDSPPTNSDLDHPTWAGAKRGFAGAAADTADTLAGFTSPASVVLAGLGAAGRIPSAIGKVSRAFAGAAGGYFGAKGGEDFVRNHPIDTAVSAGKVLTGGEPTVTPETAQHALMGGAALAGGAAGMGAGVEPIVEGVGELAGRALPKLMPKTAARMNAPLRGTSVAGPATRSQLARYASDNGIDLTAAQATESRPQQAIQAVAERGLIGTDPLHEHLEGQKAQFANVVEKFKDRMADPEITPDRESVGRNVQEQAQQKLEDLKDSARADYDDFSQKTGDAPVRISGIAQKYGDQLQKLSGALRSMPSQYAGPVREILGKAANLNKPNGGSIIMDGKEISVSDLPPKVREQLGVGDMATIDMDTAQHLRSAYSDMARDYSGNVPKKVQAIAGQIAKDLDSEMAQAANRVGATDSWRQANATWKKLQQTYNAKGAPLYKVLQADDPIKVPDHLVQPGSSGGSPQTIRTLKAENFDLGPLKRQVVDNIAEKNFNLSAGGTRLAGYSHEFLQELFEPNELSELYTMSKLGRTLKFEMNPSGTSNVTEAGHQLNPTSPGWTHKIAANAGMSRMILNPRYIEGMTGIKPRNLQEPRVRPPLPPQYQLGSTVGAGAFDRRR